MPSPDTLRVRTTGAMASGYSNASPKTIPLRATAILQHGYLRAGTGPPAVVGGLALYLCDPAPSKTQSLQPRWRRLGNILLTATAPIATASHRRACAWPSTTGHVQGHAPPGMCMVMPPASLRPPTCRASLVRDIAVDRALSRKHH